MTTSRERARGHLRRSHYCSCGRVLHGNGGKWQHAQMHKRNGDGHHYITTSEWERLRNAKVDCAECDGTGVNDNLDHPEDKQCLECMGTGRVAES